MKKVFTRLWVLGIALIMMFSVMGFCACGNVDRFNPDEEDEDIKNITIFKNDWASFNLARESNSPIYAKLKQVIGCDIIAESGASETWLQQLILRQSDGDLPEIFITEGPKTPDFFSSLIKEGDIIAISDWVTQADYPNLYAYMQQFEYMKKNISYSNGKTWFVPSKWENEKSMYIRQDWIDNLNAKLDTILVADGVVTSSSEITETIRASNRFGAPKTLLDFYRLARAFTIYDPDNNGVADTYGYMSESNMDMDAWAYVAFGTSWKQFVKGSDGQYVVSDTTDEAMYASAFLNRLMAEGYMSTDSITADMNTKQTKFIQGKAGIIYAHNWLNTFVAGIMDLDKCSIEQATAKILMCDPPAGKDGAWGGTGANGYWQGFCINANMSKARIKKCLKLYDYLISPAGTELMVYGIEGTHYSKDANGNKVTMLDKNDKGFYRTIEEYDTASLLYALVWWTGHFNLTTTTNADISAPRQARSAEHIFKEDYPDLQTSATVEHLEACHDYFETNTANLILDQKKLYNNLSSWTYDAKTFGWDNLYNVSKNFKSAWNTFTKKYNNDYGATNMLDEYNKYISDGKAIKTTK